MGGRRRTAPSTRLCLWHASRPASAGLFVFEPPIGVVADDDALDDLADEVLFVRCEPARRFELQPQLLVGASLGLVEEQLIGARADIFAVFAHRCQA